MSFVNWVTGIVKLKGATDNTKIGNVGDRLKVDSDGSTTIAGGCPTISNKFSVDHWDGTPIALTVSFTSQYSYTGSGDFIGFMFDFNSSNVEIQFLVDGLVCFTMSLKDLEALQSYNSNGCNDSGTNASIMPLSKTSGDRVNFKPDCPIKFNSSVEVKARLLSGTPSLERYINYLVKAS